MLTRGDVPMGERACLQTTSDSRTATEVLLHICMILKVLLLQGEYLIIYNHACLAACFLNLSYQVCMEVPFTIMLQRWQKPATQRTVLSRLLRARDAG